MTLHDWICLNCGEYHKGQFEYMNKKKECRRCGWKRSKEKEANKYYFWSEDICIISNLISGAEEGFTDEDKKRLGKIFVKIYTDLYINKNRVVLEDMENVEKV